MKILSLEVRSVVVPMAQPHRTASGIIEASPLVLLSVTADLDGVLASGVEFDDEAIRKYAA